MNRNFEQGIYGPIPDRYIRQLGAITPYCESEKRPGIISYGETSFGYDVRLGEEVRVFANTFYGVIDPKRIDDRLLQHTGYWSNQEATEKWVIVPPNSYALGETIETFKIPRGCLAICLGKSTYARCGLIVNVTPLEPEWEGKLTLEMSNSTPCPIRVYINEGICQIVFLASSHNPKKSYKDKLGKYQGQVGLTLPIVEGASQ